MLISFYKKCVSFFFVKSTLVLTSFILFFPRYTNVRLRKVVNLMILMNLMNLMNLNLNLPLCARSISFSDILIFPFLRTSKTSLTKSSLVSFSATGTLSIRRHNLLPYCSSSSILLPDIHSLSLWSVVEVWLSPI